jgi:hypothetical protein
MCFVVHKITSELEHMILTTLYLEVLMVPSSAIIIVTDGECLTCSGFSLCKTVCLGSFEFIADYFTCEPLP